MKLYSAAVMLLWIAVAFGCSGVGSNPVQPTSNPVNSANSTSVETHRQLWGMWDIGIDLETLTATVVPDRSAENHFNVLPFLSPPKCSDCLKLHINGFDVANSVLDLDVTLKNRFDVSGYDVRAILYTDALGHLLKNDDGYTPFFDVPGGDTINPFKAYSTDDPQRKFPGLGSIAANYKIWVPNPPKYALIKYAVDASFPANCAEPYAIQNFTQGRIINEVGSGATVSVDVLDWQNDVNSVTLQASVITGEDTTTLTHKTGNTWSADVANNKAVPAGDYKVRFAATSTGSGAATLYEFVTLKVSQPDGWARSWGASSDEGLGVAVDGSGNLYVAGYFAGTVDFDPGSGTDTHTSKGFADMFLSKYDASGNFIWARTWGGNAADHGISVAADGSGNAYVTGYFQDTADFDPGSGTDNHTSAGFGDIFLSKFDASGNFAWARTWGGAGFGDEGDGVAVDGSGNPFVAGQFSGTVDFDPGSGTDNHKNGGAFLSSFDSSGNFKWARTWVGSVAYGVATDGSGMAYATGQFSGTVDFDPGTAVDNHSSAGDKDCFVTKFDTTGAFKWARTWGGASADQGYGVGIDQSGNAYVTGNFQDVADFDPGAGTDNHTSNGNTDIFLSKFDTSGAFKWARTWGGTNVDQGSSVTSDSSGVYATGYYSGTADFDPGAGVDNHTSNGFKDIYLSKFDSSGNFVWARAWGGAKNEMGSGVDLDSSSHVYMSGWFISSVDFDPGTGVDIHDNGGSFLSKFPSSGLW